MKGIKIKTIITVLITFLILLSGYLTYIHEKGEEVGVCIIDPNGKSPCSDVQNTPYGSFLGVKVCHWGLVAFIILLLLHLVASTNNKYHKPVFKLFLLATFIGSLIALYFLFVQFFILKTLCSICIIIDVATILIFLMALAESHNRRVGLFI